MPDALDEKLVRVVLPLPYDAVPPLALDEPLPVVRPELDEPSGPAEPFCDELPPVVEVPEPELEPLEDDEPPPLCTPPLTLPVPPYYSTSPISKKVTFV